MRRKLNFPGPHVLVTSDAAAKMADGGETVVETKESATMVRRAPIAKRALVLLAARCAHRRVAHLCLHTMGNRSCTRGATAWR